MISVKDNAGGVKLDDLNVLIAPGGNRNDPLAELIGVFGVGAKRAAIALAENIEIRTRHENGKTHELDITKQWVESDDCCQYAHGSSAINLHREIALNQSRALGMSYSVCLAGSENPMSRGHR